MLRSLFLLLLPLLALAGCCGNVACRCNDRLANSLFISIGRHNGSGPTKFSARELATVYLARYSYTTKRTVDSLPLPRATRQPTSFPVPLATADTAGLLVVSDSSPFSATTANANLSKYYYKLYVPRDSSNGQQLTRHSYYQYVFDSITLRGTFEADGCCTCYNNNAKLVRVSTGRAELPDGTPFSATQATDVAGDTGTPTASRPPVVIYLTK